MPVPSWKVAKLDGRILTVSQQTVDVFRVWTLTVNPESAIRKLRRSRSPLRVNVRSHPFQPKLVVNSVSEFLLAA